MCASVNRAEESEPIDPVSSHFLGYHSSYPAGVLPVAANARPIHIEKPTRRHAAKPMMWSPSADEGLRPQSSGSVKGALPEARSAPQALPCNAVVGASVTGPLVPESTETGLMR